MEVSDTKYRQHYSNKQRILLVGEGDFSFSLCLAKAFGSATNITATSLDTRVELQSKYSDAKENVEELEGLGCTVIHGVDVHSMNTNFLVALSTPYDRIIFNFPHAGFHFGREHDSYTIMKHQELVRGFLKSAGQMVNYIDGEIHVTHKTAYPFTNWNVTALALEQGLFYYKEMTFYTWQYPGYSNKRGSGTGPDSSFPVGDSSTFVFTRRKLNWA